jgi:hypothetical protein
VTGWVAGRTASSACRAKAGRARGPTWHAWRCQRFLRAPPPRFAAAQTTTSIGALGTRPRASEHRGLYGALSGFATRTAWRPSTSASQVARSGRVRAERARGFRRRPGRRDARRSLSTSSPAREAIRHGPDSTDRSPSGWRPQLGACAAHTPGPHSLSMDAALQQARAADRPSLAEWIRAGLHGRDRDRAPGGPGAWCRRTSGGCGSRRTRTRTASWSPGTGSISRARTSVVPRVTRIARSQSGRAPAGAPGLNPAPDGGARATSVPWVEGPAPGSNGPTRQGSGAAVIGQPSGIAGPSPAPPISR